MSVLPTDIVYYGALAMPGYDGSTTLTAGIATTTATTMTVASAASFPQSGEFPIIVDSEIMWVTQGAGTTSWTMLRGMGGTTAATHSNGATVTSVSGGPVDFLTRIAFTDITSGDTLDIVSSSASDTKPIVSVAGRDTTGVLLTGKTGTLNGTTVVAGIGAAQAFGRLLYVGLGAGTTATGSLTNVATSLTVAAATNFPAAGNYFIQMGREVMQVTAGQGTTTWTISRGQLGTTATAHNSGDGIYLLPAGDVAIFDHTKVIGAHTLQAGSAQSTGTTPALAKLQAGDGASVAIGQIIRTTGGTGPNQIRIVTAVTGYGTDFVAVHRDWDTLPDATTTYDVVKGWVLEFKTGSGVGATVNNQVTAIQRFLWGAASDVPGGSSRSYYEKFFVVNNNTATAFTSSQVEILSESPSLPSGALLDIGLTSGLNDTASVATRQTAPGGITFTTQPAFVSVPAPGNLPSGAAPNAAGAQAVWARATLPAGAAPYNGAATVRTNGNTI